MNASLEIPLHLKSIGGAGEFVGIAWDYSQVDRHGDSILPGAFLESLRKHTELGSMPALLWQHKQDEPIGAWLEINDTREGLEAHGRLELSIPRAAEAYQLLKSKGLSLSVGFQAAATDSYVSNGVRYFERVDLGEISLVSVPANPGAVVRGIKSLSECSTERDFESMVRDALGLSRRQAKMLTGLAWPALNQRDAGGVDDSEQQLAAAIHKAASLIRGDNHV